MTDALSAALAAVAIDRGGRLSWLGELLPSPPRALLAGDSQAAAEHMREQLAQRLYRSFYVSGHAVPMAASEAASGGALRQAGEWSQALSRANTGSGSWRQGWQLLHAHGQDAIVVNNGAVNRTININGVNITAAGNEGIELNVDGTGNLDAVVRNSGVTSTRNSFDAATSAAGGDLELVLSNNRFTSNAGTGVNLDGSLGGTLTVTEMADKLLANPVIESYRVEVD